MNQEQFEEYLEEQKIRYIMNEFGISREEVKEKRKMFEKTLMVKSFEIKTRWSYLKVILKKELSRIFR